MQLQSDRFMSPSSWAPGPVQQSRYKCIYKYKLHTTSTVMAAFGACRYYHAAFAGLHVAYKKPASDHQMCVNKTVCSSSIHSQPASQPATRSITASVKLADNWKRAERRFFPTLNRILRCVEIAQRSSSDVPHETALGDALGRPCSSVHNPVDRASLHVHIREVPQGFFEFFGVIEQLQGFYFIIYRESQPWTYSLYFLLVKHID